MENDNALILKFLLTQEEENETNIIKTQLELYDYSVNIYKIENNQNLIDALSDDTKYNLVYLSAHGDDEGFTNEAGDFNSTWKTLGEHLYNYSCLEKDNILLLSCCRGGLNKVAYEMFFICPEIEYICGPRLSLSSNEMLIGFNVFLFNSLHLQIDPIVATEKVLKATDLRFKCFDRLETISETGYLLHTEVLEIIPIDLNNDGEKEGIIVNEKNEETKVYDDDDALEQNQ